MAAMKISWKSWFALAALLGIVAAVAIPQYADYTHRAQASEAISLMGGAKIPLAEYFQNQRKWPERLEQVVEHTSGKYTQSVAISKGAGSTGEIELTATMRIEGVDRRVRGQTVRMLSADGGRTWICRPGNMPNRNLPGACRDQN
jgi:type IV pilus assembly protein PilA